MAKVISINLSEKKGVVKKPISEGVFIENYGLKADAHAGKWHRQVSLLGKESFDKMIEKSNNKIDLSPGIFGENLTTEGIKLYELKVGTKILAGEVELEVTQIGKECHEGCEIRALVGDCVMPREGIFTRVLKGGKIKPYDKLEII